MTPLVPASCVGLGLALLWTAYLMNPMQGFRQIVHQHRRVIARRLPENVLGSRRSLSIYCGASFTLIALGLFVVSGLVTLALAGATLFVALSIRLVCLRATRVHKARRHALLGASQEVEVAVHEGCSVPEALSRLGLYGPPSVRDEFRRLSRHGGFDEHFEESLRGLQVHMNDASADRFIEGIRLTHEVTGSDVGLVLRTLRAFLRDEEVLRERHESRSTWMHRIAGLALAVPWVVLGIIALDGTARAEGAGLDAFQCVEGELTLLAGTLLSAGAYFATVCLGQVPQAERMLQ